MPHLGYLGHFRERQAGEHPEAALGPGPRGELPAEHCHPLAHADDPVPALNAAAAGAGGASGLPGRPGPSSVISSATDPAPYRTETVAVEHAACLITLVSASCTIR